MVHAQKPTMRAIAKFAVRLLSFADALKGKFRIKAVEELTGQGSSRQHLHSVFRAFCYRSCRGGLHAVCLCAYCMLCWDRQEKSAHGTFRHGPVPELSDRAKKLKLLDSFRRVHSCKARVSMPTWRVMVRLGGMHRQRPELQCL